MFGTPLTHTDYPLYVIGASIYRRLESAPLMTVSNNALATDICRRLNITLEIQPMVSLIG